MGFSSAFTAGQGFNCLSDLTTPGSWHCSQLSFLGGTVCVASFWMDLGSCLHPAEGMILNGNLVTKKKQMQREFRFSGSTGLSKRRHRFKELGGGVGRRKV